MKKLFMFGLMAAFLAAGCRKIEIDGDASNNGNNGGGTGETVILSGKIGADKTLNASSTYKLRGIVYVVDGATLTVEAGTRIVGEKSSRGALVITRGARLIANGTREKPIVFTSDAASPLSGDWGGIVMLGRARTNSAFNGTAGLGEIEGGINNAEGLGLYGGADDSDNSGSLQYVRIEYAGYAFLPDKELNALTLGGVGSGTTINHVQVAYSLDDAFEFFGGSVNASHLISYKTLDDDFDTDNGYRGTIQFGLVLRDSTRADISKVEGFESDNDANGSQQIPVTAPVFSNFTIIGPMATPASTNNPTFLAGAQIRRFSSLSIFNSIIVGWSTGILIDGSKGTPTDLNIRSGNLQVQNTVIAGAARPVDYAASSTALTGWTRDSAQVWLNTPGYGNLILPSAADLKIAAPFNYASPDFSPLPGSPALSGASFTNSKVSGLTPVSFRGAVGVSGTPEGDWYKGWTTFK